MNSFTKERLESWFFDDDEYYLMIAYDEYQVVIENTIKYYGKHKGCFLNENKEKIVEFVERESKTEDIYLINYEDEIEISVGREGGLFYKFMPVSQVSDEEKFKEFLNK